LFSYLLFFGSSDSNWGNKNMSMHCGCRETAIGNYNRYIQYSNKALTPDPLYFCHVHKNLKIQELLTQNCLNMCKDVWKNVPCEIVKFSEIKDCSQVKNYHYQPPYGTDYSNQLLVKVDNLVNPVDISLVLWCAWFSIKALRGNNRKYYIIKKCSDLIPDTYPGIQTGGFFNGPDTFISSIYNYYYSNRELRTSINKVLEEVKGKHIINPNITVNIREALA
jgi:hypothetical protein